MQAFGGGTRSALGEIFAEPENERFEHGGIDFYHLAGEHRPVAPQLRNRQAGSQADLADRKQTYEEIQRILIDEVPRIIPVFRPIFQGLRLNVRNCDANQKQKLLLYRCWLSN